MVRSRRCKTGQDERHGQILANQLARRRARGAFATCAHTWRGRLESVIQKLDWYEVALDAESTPEARPIAARYRDLHIHIEGSTVGQLNLGPVIGNIETHLNAIQGPSADEVKALIKDLVEQVLQDKELAAETKRDAIESIEFLSASAAEPPEERRLSVVKAVLEATAGLLNAGGSAIVVWQAAEPILHKFFGL